ncbi:E3 ubiquitin-protein ligase TRIM58 isoform X1 [Hylobates moloch]|uniref:E3 ubiquitin-protein ligase TRIM58 isoform X1 n=2 Tax=Hylobates moloch TaxID=81572 RepID=UPI002675A1F4|nr:E3 ubiquitin-protein ligase TRIM58 isoform X1 [Hylobates moloch]
MTHPLNGVSRQPPLSGIKMIFHGHYSQRRFSLRHLEKVKLQMALELVRKELEDTLTQEANVGRKTVIWKEKVEMQRQRFKLEFEKHRGFLAQEEQRQLRWLEAEERTTLQRLRESRNRLAQQSKALKELADELQERCQRPALGLLEGVRGVLNRSKAVTRLEAENIPMELKTACCIPGRRELLRKFQGLFNHTRAHQVLFMMLLATVLTSLFGNALMILLIHRDRRLHTPMYFLLSQLSLMDVMLVSTTVPKMAADYLTGNKAVSRAGCGVQIFFLPTLGGGECFLLAAMAYDRYAAVCHPLRYPTLMSWQLCLRMTMSCWLLGAADGLLQAVATLSFPYCGAHEIDHFFCEAPVLVRVACADTSVFENAMYICCVLMLLVPLSLILSSYGLILAAVLHMRSTEARKKAFATCSSHVAVVGLFYGAAIFTYMRPKSHRSTNLDKVVSAFYTMFTPLLNPLIYGVRNSEVKEALTRCMGRCVALSHE